MDNRNYRYVTCDMWPDDLRRHKYKASTGIQFKVDPRFPTLRFQMPVSRISTTNPASEPRRRRSSHLLYREFCFISYFVVRNLIYLQRYLPSNQVFIVLNIALHLHPTWLLELLSNLSIRLRPFYMPLLQFSSLLRKSLFIQPESGIHQANALLRAIYLGHLTLLCFFVRISLSKGMFPDRSRRITGPYRR